MFTVHKTKRYRKSLVRCKSGIPAFRKIILNCLHSFNNSVLIPQHLFIHSNITKHFFCLSFFAAILLRILHCGIYYLNRDLIKKAMSLQLIMLGHLTEGDSMKGTLREGSFTGEPERWGFWDMQNALYKGLSLHRGPVGEPGGGSFAETFERK